MINFWCVYPNTGFSSSASDKEPSCQCKRHKRHRFDPSVRKIPCRMDGRATHSSILAWRIPWTEEPGRLQSVGLQRFRHGWSNLAHTLIQTHVFLFGPMFFFFDSTLLRYNWNTLDGTYLKCILWLVFAIGQIHKNFTTVKIINISIASQIWHPFLCPLATFLPSSPHHHLPTSVTVN